MNYKAPRYDRLILALNDDELEGFVREWALKKTEYVEVQRFTGPGDMGRDVVGFHTKERHEGSWHNYQCKQYGKTLQTSVGLKEVGKLLYYSFLGEFTRPTAYKFVAPRGVNRNLKRLIANPSQFRSELFSKWDEYCAKGIVEGKTIPLDPTLQAFIRAWDFSQITALSIDDILGDPVSLRYMPGLAPTPAHLLLAKFPRSSSPGRCHTSANCLILMESVKTARSLTTQA